MIVHNNLREKTLRVCRQTLNQPLQSWLALLCITKTVSKFQMKKSVLIGGVAALMLTISSCSTEKPNLTVFDDMVSAKTDGAVALGVKSITLRPQDELYISVSSTEPSATAAYNIGLSNPATKATMQISQTPKQQTYIVNDDGDITFPELGKLHVEGLTTQQLTELLTERISQDVSNPLVRVELMNFTVNVIGEVKQPSRINVTNERFSILDALAAAGHMTEYGDRTNVTIVRENNGQAEYHVINLNNSDVVSSPYYYLQQNDVVLVAPTESRESNARYDSNNSYRVQVVSTIVSAISVIASLVIALSVK